MTAVAGFLAFGLVVLIGLLLYVPLYKEHFDAYGVRVRPRKKEANQASEAPRESVILSTSKGVGDSVLKMFPNLVDKRTQELMMYGNYRTPEHMATFIGVKAILAITIALAILISSGGEIFKVLLIVPAVAVSWLMPNFFLAGRVRKRQYKLVTELPTVIDLMIVCAQAGLGLLMCMQKVSVEVVESCPILAAEIQQMLQDVKVFAKPVPVALKDMGDRCGVEELAQICASLIAAESKGSDISYPLRQQAIALRDRMKRKKEEEASQVPVKMVPVIMLFVMPLILCPMLGPAVITIMQALGPVFSGK
jgi:tight adherence protein C